MKKNPKVFVSYSWDNDEQQEWVIALVNGLRQNGVDATLDKFETQKGTVNLYSMMIDRIKESDYTLIIVTNAYVDKADSTSGGVGFETKMLIPYIEDNLYKIIPIINTKWNSSRRMPFYLRGAHYIDFSNSKIYEDSFSEFLHRIFKVDLIEKAELGGIPELVTKRIGRNKNTIGELENTNENDVLIPNLKVITDLDKNKFIKESYILINSGLLSLLEKTQSQNSNFEYDADEISKRKTVYKFYTNGKQVYAIKIWLGNNFGGNIDTINLAYGNYNTNNDNSTNEIISCEVGENKTLELKMMMNMFGNRNANTPDLVLKEIWMNIIQYLRPIS